MIYAVLLLIMDKYVYEVGKHYVGKEATKIGMVLMLTNHTFNQ